MDIADQPSHSPVLSGLLLMASAAFWAGIFIATGGGNAFFRAVVSIIVALSLAGLILVFLVPGRRAGDALLWALLGIETALALLTVSSLTIHGWLPAVLTALTTGCWPRGPGQPALMPFHLAVQVG